MCVCVGGGGGGREYTYRYTVTPTKTSALRWAAMRAILMFHNCEGQSRKTVSADHNLWRERRAEADSNRGPSAYQPNALPLGQTGSHHLGTHDCVYIVSPAVSTLRLVVGCFLVKSNVKVIKVYLDHKPHRHLGTHDYVYIVSPAVSTLRLVVAYFLVKSDVKIQIIGVYLDPSSIAIWEHTIACQIKC